MRLPIVGSLMLAAWGLAVGCLPAWHGLGEVSASEVGFLVTQAGADSLGPEAQAAWLLAQRLASAELVIVGPDGQFFSAQGHARALEQFRVVWYHQGDAAQPAPALADPENLGALRKFCEGGGGLFLSGAALALIHTLGIEPAAPRQASGGSDRYVAQLIPVQTHHPVLAGLKPAGNLPGAPVPISDAGYPAFADFFGSGGPTRGMLLARANAGAENPLVECAARGE